MQGTIAYLSGNTRRLSGVGSHSMNQLSKILSSRVRAQIFRFLFGIDKREFHLRDLERKAGLHRETIRQDLKKLLRLDLVTSRRDGNRLYYRANESHPLYRDIRNLVLKTSGLVDVLRTALEGKDLKVAFVFGSVAEGDEKAASDIDLLIIGDVGLRKLARDLAGAADEVGREINPVVMSETEFRNRKKSGEHFLAGVLGSSKTFVIGDEDDLEAMG